MHNTGLDLGLERQHQSDQDWVFGAVSDPCLTDMTDTEPYLPNGEVQFGVEDFMDCASRGPVNLLEAKFNWLLRNNKLLPENKEWLRDNGYMAGNAIEFSDRFIAIKSNTTRTGNSLKAPCDTIYRSGLIPKRMLPKGEGMTWDEYHDKSKITPAMERLGKEFLKRFTINYERVNVAHFAELMKEDIVDLALHAWPEPKKGVYPKTDGDFNHCVIGYKPKYFIFDNYFDNADGDFVKQLAPDFTFYEYGYRVYISSQQLPSKTWWQVLLEWILGTEKGARYVFNNNLHKGALHPDVIGLQKLLNSDPDTLVAATGNGSPGQETDYFGWKTTDALIRFQKKHGIFPPSGYFGPITRQFINEKIYMESPSETLYRAAKAHIGQNLAPGMEVLGCAISLSAVYNRAFPARTLLRFVNTTQFYEWLEKNAVKLESAQPDCVIVSPTSMIPSGGPLKNGHIGVVGRIASDDGSNYIMSNNSIKGVWDVHWTVEKWNDYYGKYGRIPTFYYKLV